MAGQQPPDVKLPDPVEISKSMAAIAERSQKLVADFLARQKEAGGNANSLDPLNIGAAFMEVTQRMMADPAKLVQAQRSEEHTSELQSLMRISYAVFCLKKKKRRTY